MEKHCYCGIDLRFFRKRKLETGWTEKTKKCEKKSGRDIYELSVLVIGKYTQDEEMMIDILCNVTT